MSIGGESEELIADSDFGSFMLHRLNLEGASWDADAGYLDIAKSDVIAVTLPKTSFRWARAKRDLANHIEVFLCASSSGHLFCATQHALAFLQVPMYLNRQRTSLLFTIQLPVKPAIATSVWYVACVVCSVCVVFVISFFVCCQLTCWCLLALLSPGMYVANNT